MNELMKADIFFYVTTISVVIVTILLAIALIYVIMIIRKVNNFVEKIKEEGDEVIEDIKGMAGSAITFISKMIGLGRRTNRRK